MRFRVHAAYRTATRQRTEVSKEDERPWDWTSTVKRSGEDSAEREQEAAGTKRSHSAPTEAGSSYRAKQEPGGPAATKTESAAGPVVSRKRAPCILQPVASSSAEVQTDSTLGRSLGLARNFDSRDDGNPNVQPHIFHSGRRRFLLQLHKHDSSAHHQIRGLFDTIEEISSTTSQLEARIHVQRVSTISSHKSSPIHASFIAFLTATTLLFPGTTQELSCLVGQHQTHGGYAGIRVGEAVNTGPATHERDWTDEQPDPSFTGEPTKLEIQSRAVRIP